MTAWAVSAVLAALGGAAMFLVIRNMRAVVQGKGDPRLGVVDLWNEQLLAQLDRLDITGSSVTRSILLCALFAFIVAWLLSGSFVPGIAAGAAAASLPRAYLRRQRMLRIARFNEQLPTGLDMLTSSARAGLSLSQCVEEVARSGPPILAGEFARIAADVKLGSPVATSLLKARDRLGSAPFKLVTTALLVSIDRGGNLAESLQTLSESLKEIWRLEQKLITASAEARKAMMVISGVPVFVAVLAMVVQPDIARSLTSSFAGISVLLLAGLFYGLGLAWVRKLLRANV